MIYRGVKLETEEKKKDRRDLLKAVGIAAGMFAVIAGVIFLMTKFGM